MHTRQYTLLEELNAFKYCNAVIIAHAQIITLIEHVRNDKTTSINML